MNQKKAKRIRQLVRHMQDKGVVDNQSWINYGLDQKFVNMSVPDADSPTVFDEEGKLVMTMKNVLVPTGCRKLDPTSGRAIYQAMKSRGDRIANHRQ